MLLPLEVEGKDLRLDESPSDSKNAAKLGLMELWKAGFVGVWGIRYDQVFVTPVQPGPDPDFLLREVRFVCHGKDIKTGLDIPDVCVYVTVRAIEQGKKDAWQPYGARYTVGGDLEYKCEYVFRRVSPSVFPPYWYEPSRVMDLEMG